MLIFQIVIDRFSARPFYINQVEKVRNLDQKNKLISQYEYTYDFSGNILTEVITQDGRTTTWQYGYNSLGELSAAKATGAEEIEVTYGYDQAGNKVTIERSEKNAQGAAQKRITQNTYNAVNRLVESRDSIDGTAGYEYDADGNLIRELDVDEAVYTYTYYSEL